MRGVDLNILIYPNFKKVNAINCVYKVCKILHENNVNIYFDKSNETKLNNIDYLNFGNFSYLLEICDFIIVIGGDGTILKCSHSMQNVNNKPILAINSGRLGFMSALESNELNYLEDFLNGHYTIKDCMMLHAKVKFKNGNVYEQSVLNDVVVSKSPLCKIADFKVFSDEICISALRADGLIFSSPTGATAYSLSAGGPIIDPEMNCIEFTQICPFSLSSRTMIFGEDKILKIKYSANNKTDVYITFDGHNPVEFSVEDELYIYKSSRSIKFVDLNRCNFYHSVNEKLMKPLKSKNEV